MSTMSPVAKRLAKHARRLKITLRRQGWDGGRVRALDIRAGDTVQVLAGKDRGKRGVVERVLIADQRIVVRGVNLMKRHTKAGVAGNMQGGIVDFNGPIAYANVQLVCTRCDRITRIRHEVAEDGARVLICQKCGERYERVNS
ncbi:MAG: 50S ribosomal protein L24 [Candidatus Dormibacteria bacterium]|jgi:large subunit ribosomal protein L24